ncbi:MAG TPA: acyl-CoA dehydrogenase family protein [Tepidisphaeraceae bacterium]|nr:acyl-CoA dehydrogenase family protein [Tepidisphaeraceae bacterium]
MPTFKRADQEQFERAKDLIETEPKELGFVKSMFFGRLKPDQVLPYPQQDADEARRTDELIARLDEFLKREVDADRIDAEERIPPNVIEGLGKLGVLGMTVPKEFGGGGFSHTAYCRVLEHVARHCTSTAVFIGAHQSIGLKALLLMGTEEQKRQYLPALASGEKIAAFCLSEPQVGSDAANVQTTARLSDDGSHWILNGEKKYATNAALAGFMTVMAKTPVTDERGKTRDKVTAFIVTPDLPGFEVVKSNRSKCGIRGSWQAVLRFTDMRVPSDRILGGLGKGLKVALSVLNYGRCTMSAGCVGGAKLALEMCIDRARTRKQFGRAIGEFHLVKEKLARMAESVFAMDAMTYLAAGLVDRHVDDLMLETAICKLFCSEAAWQVIDDAVQLWGGEGYMRETGLERMLRDARINRIVEGTSEVMTAFISLVGMKGVGEDLEQVMRLAKHPVGNFGRLATFARGEWSDVVMGHSLEGLHPKLSNEGRTFARLTKLLARDVVRLLGKHRERILDMELVHQRVTGAAMELYAMAAVISRMQMLIERSERATEGNGHDKLRRDLTVGRSFSRHAAQRVERHLDSLFSNQDEDVLQTANAVLGWECDPSAE